MEPRLYPQNNDHYSDVVYWKGGGTVNGLPLTGNARSRMMAFIYHHRDLLGYVQQNSPSSSSRCAEATYRAPRGRADVSSPAKTNLSQFCRHRSGRRGAPDRRHSEDSARNAFNRRTASD